MKRFTRLCRAGAVSLLAWIIALQVLTSQPVHMLVLLVSCTLSWALSRRKMQHSCGCQEPQLLMGVLSNHVWGTKINPSADL